MADCWGTYDNGVSLYGFAQKNGKTGPIDKDWTPSYLSGCASQARSREALYVARRMKPEKRHPQGASGGAGRIEQDAEPKRICS